MDAGTTSYFSRVLISGPPGIGKTTVCKKVVLLLERQNRKFDGFYTEEIRGQSKERIGFDVVPVKNPDRRTPLARAKSVLAQTQYSPYCVGNYHVFPKDFESVVLPLLNSPADILLIDEIGKMELFSKKFYETILKICFEWPSKVCLVATIPQVHKAPRQYLSLFQRLLEDKSSKIITVTRENRDSLPEEIVRLLL
ncbi:hypothetical protein KM043_009970 [Ampulex compressa]|nr:hypothetical protein KM043_009970 [Ampulex compressa]